MHYLKLLLPLILVASCSRSSTNDDYLARVGNQVLTVQTIESTIGAVSMAQDSSETMQQIVEGWIKDELIAQEAIRQGLRNDAEVQRLIAESERQVLVSAFLNKLFLDNTPEPSEEEIESYYAQNIDQLTLRDDYLRVRYLSTSTQNRANQVRILLRDATAAGKVDSLWPSLVNQFAVEKEISLTLSENLYPSGLLFSSARLKDMVNQLAVNQISGVIEESEMYHVVQLAEKRPAGTTPELSWIKEELTERLIIDARKQMVARQVQRLRTEALAQEDLEIRYLDE